MNFFSSHKQTKRREKIAGAGDAMRQILDSYTGRSIRMFECKCGEHTWSN